MKALIAAAAIGFAGVAALPLYAASSLPTLADAADLPPGGFRWADTGAGRPVRIVISLTDQRAYIYRGAALVAVTAVSTGREGKDTPIGEFTVLQKEATHRSSRYHAAPMPFMQRLTWDGVAIHAGSTPGFPDSHGCVHVPTVFARKLFAVTRVGTRVSVIDASIDAGAMQPMPVEPGEVIAATPGDVPAPPAGNSP